MVINRYEVPTSLACFHHDPPTDTAEFSDAAMQAYREEGAGVDLDDRTRIMPRLKPRHDGFWLFVALLAVGLAGFFLGMLATR